MSHASTLQDLHEHCWHKQGGYEVGNGRSGIDLFVCCHCQEGERRPWRAVPDPNHGPYANVFVKDYFGDREKVRLGL